MPTILIVDDSSFARLNISRHLKAAGYQILEAASGQQAIEIVSQTPPDLVTLDLLMPNMSGLEALTQMKNICPKTKVLVVTADVQVLTREELLNAGADGFINKPVSKEELLSSIENLLLSIQNPG
jgi:CheY-like chemotaxis protein